MARTLKRQPYSVSTSNKSYSTSEAFIQAEFKGINDTQNDVLVDQMSFADANNVYVDDNMLLVSRPPFKFYDGDCQLLRVWRFGEYQIRLYRNIEGVNTCTFKVMTDVRNVLDTKSFASTSVDVDVMCVPIEDKIFIWFANLDFFVFNTNTEKFESVTPHIYIPITSLLVNGIEKKLESENFLTPTQRKRHQYSALSSVDFDTLIGKTIDVNLTGSATADTSKHLYSTTISDTNPVLIYPRASIGTDFHFDVASGEEIIVYMRYNLVTKTIAVSFDGRYFEQLPEITNIIGLPRLTKDANHVVAFTNEGLAWYKLFVDTSTEYQFAKQEWEFVSFASARGIHDSGSFEPFGSFDSREQYACCYCEYYADDANDVRTICLRAEWPKKTGGICVYDGYIDSLLSVGTDSTYLQMSICNMTSSNQLCVGICGKNIAKKTFSLAMIILSNGAVTKILEQDLNKTYYLEKVSYTFDSLISSSERSDFKVSFVGNERVELSGAFTAKFTNGTTAIIADAIVKGNLMKLTTGYSVQIISHTLLPERSNQLKFADDSFDVISNKYLYRNGAILPWPTIEQSAGEIVNGMSVSITLADGSIQRGNIHKVEISTDNIVFSGGQIRSGDFVVWKMDAIYEREYFMPDVISGGNAYRMHIFKIERITSEGAVLDGTIKSTDIVRLTAYSNQLELKPNFLFIGHSYLTVVAWTYPGQPSDWRQGDDWPSSWSPSIYPRPLNWTKGNNLPTSSVVFEGPIGIDTQIRPLFLIGNNVDLNVNASLWTSALSVDDILELDEFKNANADNSPQMSLQVPTHHNVLNEHYFSFEIDGKHLLETTQIKRDEDTLGMQLYLPKRNEQLFPEKITNLHPIADNVLSVFTPNSIWNITAMTLDDGSIAYSAPIISKIPAGCRDGDDVMTGLDGQAVLLATPRGIAALAPQDFVATADNTISYLSDPIQDMYYHFYADRVAHVLKSEGYSPNVKMCSYRYWLLFYRPMDRTILTLDTRTGAWWKWSTPYPIKELIVDLHLHLLLQIDNSQGSFKQGVYYVWRDHEDTVYENMLDLVDTSTGYCDDVLENTISGAYSIVYENAFVGERTAYEAASSIIDWYFTSQKLHFNSINNYKAIRGMTVILKGDDVLHASLTTKTYRSSYHPERSDTMQIPINELKTFVHRLNSMHVINFQYKLENDENADVKTPLKLGSLTIKYEVKEGIR